MLLSLSTWRVWIEIIAATGSPDVFVSLSTWRVWIEMELIARLKQAGASSLSTWRVWIEIY